MRQLLSIAMASLAFVPLCALAQETRPSISAAELEQELSVSHPGRVLRKTLLQNRLSERLSAAELNRLLGKVGSSRDARAALWLLADEAIDLPLPPSTAPMPDKPDADARRAILTRAFDYASQLHARLPNLNAVRHTTYLEVLPEDDFDAEQRHLYRITRDSERLFTVDVGKVQPHGNASHLYLRGTWDTPVNYRNGLEQHGSSRRSGALSEPPAVGLSSIGEFGPLLSLVLTDAVRGGTFFWSGWEQGIEGPVAVLTYAVPQPASHFHVRNEAGVFFDMPTDAQTPAYHGEIAIHPDTGIIERILVIAATEADDRASWKVAVDYAPVDIGGRTYWCPSHAAAIFSLQPGRDGKTRLIRYSNHTEFTDYHIFRSEMRILPAD